MSDEHESRRRAYEAGARIARAKMEREAPEQAAALDEVVGDDIVVVRGCYDRVEQVLNALNLPHTAVDPEDVGRLRLRPEQLLVINCPGKIDARAVGKVARFVSAGGSLFTTDWALRHVIEPAFPGVLAYNERPTADDVVRIEIRARDNRVPQRRPRGRGRPAVVARGLLLPDPDPRPGPRGGAAHLARDGRQVRRGADRGALPVGRGRGAPHGQPLLPAADRAAHGPPQPRRWPSRRRKGSRRPPDGGPQPRRRRVCARRPPAAREHGSPRRSGGPDASRQA